MGAKLGKFENREVMASTIAVTNAGDGLSESMKTEPQLLHHGDVVYVVLECEVTKVTFEPVKGADDRVERKHTLRAGTATIVDSGLVDAQLEEQRERNRRRADEEKGQGRLPSDQELAADHRLGGHAGGIVEDCPECLAEADAAEQEKGSE